MFTKNKILSKIIRKDENILWSRQKSLSSLWSLIITIIILMYVVWLIVVIDYPDFMKISLILGLIPILILIIIFFREHFKKRNEDILYFISNMRIGKIRNFRKESAIIDEASVKDLTSIQIFYEAGKKTSINVYFFTKDDNTFYFEDMRDLKKILMKNFNLQIVEKWSKTNEERVLKKPYTKSQSIIIQVKIISITPKSIESIFAQQGWKGTGTLKDPYVVENSFQQLALSLKNISEGVIIRGLEDKEISLENCENLTIENSSLLKLSFYNCYKITVKKCKLDQVNVTWSQVHITWSRENIFLDNEMTQEALDRILFNLADKHSLQLVKWSFPIVLTLISVMYFSASLDGRLDLTDIPFIIFSLFIAFTFGIITIFVITKTSKLKHVPSNRVIELS